VREPALVVEDYSFWFKLSGGRRLLALDKVSFSVDVGDFVLVLGPSGSGKSTLALNLVGVYPDYYGGYNEGRILVNHSEKGLVNRRDLDRGQRFKTVNMLFQNPEDQIVTLTVEEELAFALENYLVPASEISPLIDRALDRFVARLRRFDEIAASLGRRTTSIPSDDMGKWRAHRTVSPIDDSQTITLSLHANSTISAWPDRKARQSLIVRFKEGTLDCYINLGVAPNVDGLGRSAIPEETLRNGS
jgi:ABC-type dipeptide/oligopeptide/nickel transport system ATPase subunit